MALNIKSDRVDRLARELGELTGESLTTAVEIALRERVERERRRRHPRRLDHIVERYGALEVLDDRDPDDILGYDEHGIAT